jgi:hypothetical protein
MLRQMPGFVGIVGGPEHVYEYVNDAYVKISERADFVGRRFADVFPDLESQAFLTASQPGLFDWPDRHPPGHGIAAARRRRDPIHRLAYRATKALRELNADLERKVIERTQARGLTWQVSPDLLGALNSEGYFETSNPAWFRRRWAGPRRRSPACRSSNCCTPTTSSVPRQAST